MRFLFMIFLVLLFFTGLIFLQIFLSKSKEKAPGLILPSITLIIALLVSVFVALGLMTDSWLAVISTFLLFFAVGNIPTVVLFTIYKIVHKKDMDEISKMSVQDL